MRGSWVSALCSWCHCPLEPGRTLPPQGDAAQPPRLTPRMAGLATAQPPASRQLPGNQHGKTKEERREGGRPRRPGKRVWARVGYEALWPAGTLAFGLWHRFVSAQTRNLSLSFPDLLVATHGARNLERPRRAQLVTTRHVTTEACIIASAGLDTLSPATVPCLLSLVPGTPE